MSTKPRVAVVGNGVAGFACARDLADAGARVTLVGPGMPCDRPPLSKRALVTGHLPYLATARDLAAAGIVHVDGRAELDLERRELTVRPAPDRDRRIAFDQLVWATGLRPVRPPLAGIEHAAGNSEPASLEQLLPSLARPGRKVVVIGAGLIGTETAATLSARHRVTLIERAEVPLQRFHPAVSTAALSVLRECGVGFAGACSLEGIDPLPGGGRLVRIADRLQVVADVVIAAAGVASTLPAALGEGPHVDTDERLAIPGADGVWVCGDLARHPHPRYGPITVPHWDNALAGGRHVAAAILGSRAPFIREPYWFSDIGPLRIQLLGRESAVREWCCRDDLITGLDRTGTPCCVLLMNAATRLADARRLLAA